ncbi:trichohyalin isoform X2 [Entelurus aequoreus]|nr:trichohyalin isoform X2 [Entelurus aequoreus]
MGTKRPSCTLFDTFSNRTTSDRKLQPGGRHSRDPSPRPAMTAQSERESNREEARRRDREVVKMRDKTRYKDTDPRERYYERDRGPPRGPREAEREWREKRQDGDKRNGRPLSHAEREFEKERGTKKGDTFPRMRRRSGERDEGREHTRPRRMETDGRRRERVRERDTKEEKSRQRYQVGDGRARVSSPCGRRDRESHPDRRTHQRGVGTRSEGDSDEREKRRERARHRREREELTYQHSRSEGDYIGHRQADRPRRREEREPYGDRRGWSSDRRENEPRKERPRQEREADPRWKEAASRAPQRAQSSGEWSSDMDNDSHRRRAGRDDYEGEVGSERGERKSPQSAKRSEREQRRMWLEPRRGKNSKDSSLEDDLDSERREGEDEGGRLESWRREYRRSKDGEKVRGGEEVQKREKEWKETEDKSEESEGGSEAGCRQDRDRVFAAEDGFVTVSSGDEDEREEFVDCQDFLEGGDGGDDASRTREDSANEEEQGGREKGPKYVFCVIGQNKPEGTSPSQDEERDLSHSGDDESLRLRGSDEDLVDRETDRDDNRCEETPDAGHQDPRMRARKPEHPYAEIGPLKRDSQTEKLLMEWRERNKEIAEMDPLPRNPYADVYSQVTFEQILPALEGFNIEAMSPEQKEAIRIRMSGAWSMSEEPKRHSQAPHLKWAKSVVREILGHSGEEALDDSAGRDRPQPEETQADEVTRGTAEMHLDSSQSEEEEGPRGTGHSQQDMHADPLSAMHADTPAHTHHHTLIDTQRTEDHSTAADKDAEPPPGLIVVDVKMPEEADDEIREKEREASRQKEVEMYLSVSNTLYKPSSCPILNYETQPDLLVPSTEGRDEEEKEAEREEGQDGGGEGGLASESDEDSTDAAAARKPGGGTLASSCSFRDLGAEARLRRRGIRKTAERRKKELVEVEEEEGVARDRRTRVFSTTDDEDDRSKSWGEVELRNVLDTIGRRKRNSKFFNAAQLYQQYSEAAQNFEILSQSRSSDVISVSGENSSSPAPSPPPACRPLPPLPAVPHPHSLAHSESITSIRSLPLPDRPKYEGRPSSPRLSISLTQSSTLWRELPGVRNSRELEDLTEDERRLQEVRFEVLTSEASYCRSLDIVVEHFVKSKQLGALLATQDRNWLFSRLADVRAISHSFLSKLEERLESDIISFTVCDIIARHCQRFKMVYVPYLTNQSYQDATYQRLMNENPGFKRIVEKLERSPVCQRLPLRSFLVLPFQRITRIKLLVQNIVKRTTPGTADATQAIKALKLLEKLIQESNDSITQMKSIESLVSLSAKVDFECRTLPLISQSRRLVREGPVTELMDFSLKETERNIYMHLFNDYLLLSQQKEGGKFTVIDHAPVAELRAENCRVKLHSLQKNLFRLHMLNKSLLLRTDTQSDKLRWISALSRPHPEIDFSSAQDFPQMQCIRAFVAQQPDELSLEKADIILVHQQSSDHWVEGTRLSDRHRGWVPELHLELINNFRVRQRNLSDALKLTTATAAV